MQLKRQGLAAKKAWFFFDDEFVALGTDIQSDSAYAVVTSVNQCLLNGLVTVAAGGLQRVVTRGQYSLADTAWIHHDQIGYIFPQRPVVSLRNNTQTGNAHDINETRPDVPESKDVFSLWLDHGSRVSDGSYQYIVVPGVSVEELAQIAAQPHVNVISNTPAVQAVWHEKLLMLQAVFWRPGSVHIPNGMSVEVDEPCIVLLTPGDDQWRIVVTNPENPQLTVHMTVVDQFGKENLIEIKLDESQQ